MELRSKVCRRKWLWNFLLQMWRKWCQNWSSLLLLSVDLLFPAIAALALSCRGVNWILQNRSATLEFLCFGGVAAVNRCERSFLWMAAADWSLQKEGCGSRPALTPRLSSSEAVFSLSNYHCILCRSCHWASPSPNKVINSFVTHSVCLLASLICCECGKPSVFTLKYAAAHWKYLGI